MRIGHGYDVHRLVEDRKLIMGGVEIPYEKGLLGHSDADVLTHAVMDALLGAAPLEIRAPVPGQRPGLRRSGQSSPAGPGDAAALCGGWQVENVDATILAQRPKLAPYLGGMADHLPLIWEWSWDR